MADQPPQPLDVIQRWMQSVIVHPAGVAAGIDSASHTGEIEQGADRVDELICRSRAQTSIERLEVYSNAYKARLIEVLIGEYPAFVHALGEEAFVGLASGYLEVHPPASYTLGELGRFFADYLLETRPPNESEDGSPDWADFLIDLARLERCYSEVFDGPGIEELPPLDAERFRHLSPEQWITCRLVAAPCLRLAAYRFPVHEYASAVRHQQEPESPIAQVTRLAIHRREYVVRRTTIDAIQFGLLTRLVEGASIGQALEQLIEANSQAVVTADELSAWFRDWAAAGFFIGLAT
ncbi:MAG: hypothetical protein JWP89_4587 [Schlesneria sp.]|nr:hypothetical protein [Schlesneria sp.]